MPPHMKLLHNVPDLFARKLGSVHILKHSSVLNCPTLERATFLLTVPEDLLQELELKFC